MTPEIVELPRDTNIGLRTLGDRTGAVIVKGEHLWKVGHIIDAVAFEIDNDDHLHRRFKNMTTNFEQATATCEEAKKTFQRMFGGLMDEETKLAETTKRAGGNIRKATNELGDAVKKFES